jgi:drug/metabolite transporter (DMT)-like permease
MYAMDAPACRFSEGRGMTTRGYIFILLAAALWGLLGPLAKLAFREGLSPLEVAFWRAALAWVCFGGEALVKGEVRLALRDLPAVAVFGLAGVTLFYGSYQLAVESGGAAVAAVLLYTAPAWVALLAAVVLRERLTPLKLLALTLTLAGVVLISRQGAPLPGQGGGLSPAALAWGLTAGFCYSLHYLFAKRFGPRYNAANLFAYLLPVGALGLLPWVPFAPKSATAWAALAGLAILCTYGAYHFYYAGLRHLEAGRAAITATLEPVVAAVVAFIWWGEAFTAAGYAGGALILTAVGLTIRDDTRRRASRGG